MPETIPAVETTFSTAGKGTLLISESYFVSQHIQSITDYKLSINEPDICHMQPDEPQGFRSGCRFQDRSYTAPIQRHHQYP